MSPPGPGARVLVLRALGLGDALTGVAALRGVRRAWPGARVVLAAPAPLGGWLRELGVVDAVLPVEGIAPLAADALVRASREHPGALGVAHPDVGVNLHGNGAASAAALAALAPARTVAFAPAGEVAGPGVPMWREDEHEVARWCRLVTAAGGPCGPGDLVLEGLDAPGATSGPAPAPATAPTTGATGPVVVHPGAASPSRRWPVPRWTEVVAALTRAGHDVVVTGSAPERELTAAVARAGARDLGGALDLPALAALVAGARLVLCGDTGVAHLATATRTPSVLLFGPTPPSTWGPAVDTDRHTVLWPAGGAHRGDPHADALDPVLAATTAADVLAASARLLAPRSGGGADSRRDWGQRPPLPRVRV